MGKMPSSTLPPDHNPASTLPMPTPTISAPSNGVTCVWLGDVSLPSELVDVQMGEHRECPKERDADGDTQEPAVMAQRFKVANRLARHVPRELSLGIGRLERHDQQARNQTGNRHADENSRMDPPMFWIERTIDDYAANDRQPISDGGANGRCDDRRQSEQTIRGRDFVRIAAFRECCQTLRDRIGPLGSR